MTLGNKVIYIYIKHPVTFHSSFMFGTGNMYFNAYEEKHSGGHDMIDTVRDMVRQRTWHLTFIHETSQWTEFAMCHLEEKFLILDF